MPKREFFQQLSHYERQTIGGHYVSEKLDGVRCVFDGGISRGLAADLVPYCDASKFGRYVDKQYASGLWTRYGKPIIAPDWWIDRLPKLLMDGELWSERGEFHRIVSAVRSHKPDDYEWGRIKFVSYAIPQYRYWLANGVIKNPHMNLLLQNDQFKWAYERCNELGIRCIVQPQDWANGQEILNSYEQNETFRVHEQHRLNRCIREAPKEMIAFLNKVIEQGGEGVVIVDPKHYWMPERSLYALKVKVTSDSEAEVIGYTWGEETELGSKLLGLMGAMLLRWNGVTFKISGFTNEERILSYPDGSQAMDFDHPGQPVEDPTITNVQFPVGSTITFTYQTLTPDGVPRDARFLRTRNDAL